MDQPTRQGPSTRPLDQVRVASDRLTARSDWEARRLTWRLQAEVQENLERGDRAAALRLADRLLRHNGIVLDERGSRRSVAGHEETLGELAEEWAEVSDELLDAVDRYREVLRRTA